MSTSLCTTTTSIRITKLQLGILNAVGWLVIYGDSRKRFSYIDGFLEEEKYFTVFDRN